MPAASPLMDPAASATPKSSLEIMLDMIRERDERRQDDGEPFLPPSPARPRGRGRPPTSARRLLPVVFKVGNGGGSVSSAVPVYKKPAAVVGTSGAADIVHHPAIETVVDDATLPDSQEQCRYAQGQDDEDDTVMLWINNKHGAIDIVKQQEFESEITVEDERSLRDAIVLAPGGGGDADNVSPSASMSSTTRVGRRTPRQSSGSVSPPGSSSGSSSREGEPEKRTKAGVGKMLWGSTGCVRAPVAAVARMVLNSCGSNERALEEQTGQGADTSIHDAAVKSPVVPIGGGNTDVTTVTASAASSSGPRSGLVWRWLKKISCRLRDVEETTKAGLRQRKSRSTPQPQIN